jgi:hypothetical protein
MHPVRRMGLYKHLTNFFQVFINCQALILTGAFVEGKLFTNGPRSVPPTYGRPMMASTTATAAAATDQVGADDKARARAARLANSRQLKERREMLAIRRQKLRRTVQQREKDPTAPTAAAAMPNHNGPQVLGLEGVGRISGQPHCLPRCPQGHVLHPNTAPDCYCDGCAARGTKAQGTHYRCRSDNCDYDLCVRCYELLAPSLSSEASTGGRVEAGRGPSGAPRTTAASEVATSADTAQQQVADDDEWLARCREHGTLALVDLLNDDVTLTPDGLTRGPHELADAAASFAPRPDVATHSSSLARRQKRSRVGKKKSRACKLRSASADRGARRVCPPMMRQAKAVGCCNRARRAHSAIETRSTCVHSPTLALAPDSLRSSSTCGHRSNACDVRGRIGVAWSPHMSTYIRHLVRRQESLLALALPLLDGGRVQLVRAADAPTPP